MICAPSFFLNEHCRLQSKIQVGIFFASLQQDISTSSLKITDRHLTSSGHDWVTWEKLSIEMMDDLKCARSYLRKWY